MRKVRFELFQDTQGEWRWRAVSSNGKIIATGGEGYKRSSGARKSLEHLLAHVKAGSYAMPGQSVAP